MITVANFLNQYCPDSDIILVDPPYGIGKKYADEVEVVPYEAWVHMLYGYAKNHAGWLLILGPYPIMRQWLNKIPEPTQILMWHRTFTQPIRGKVRSWTRSLTPCLVYDFGGDWFGPDKVSREFHDCIDAHSSMGDSQRLKKLGLKVTGHPGVTGTAFPSKVLKPLIPDNQQIHVHDPMAGIGSILVSAQRLGCQVSGFEINPEWADIGNQWLKAERELGYV